jgi:GNAT superfamily N-acetyltransferase
VTAQFVIEPLAPQHDRSSFVCGTDALDRYLKNQAGQDVRRRIANCYVAVPVNGKIVAGYYTLSAASIPLLDLPEGETKRLPRYPVLPAALIGRLAVDRQFRGRALGAALLFDAIQRAFRAEAAVFALVVDAKDGKADAFYRHFGFQPFASRITSLFLPMATAARLVQI